MSEVLLPIRLCSPTEKELKHRRVLGGLGDVVDGSDVSDSDESDDSADNEYAEGLGFADRRRHAPASSFEFDHHPREEYFEEPKSWEGHVGRCVIQPTRDSKRPISAMLRELEAQEEREQKRPRLRGQAAQGNPQTMQSSRGGHEEAVAQLRAYGACLALLRQRWDKEGSNQSWTVEALRVLKALSKFKIGVFELQSSGIGRELSKSTWQKNRSKDISRWVRRLLRHWRRNVGLQSRSSVERAS